MARAAMTAGISAPRRDTCQSGTCTGANPVLCTALDQCHDVGTRNQSTGNCSNPNKAHGTACSDNNACTAPDQCATGTCQPGSPVADDDGDPCTIDSCDSASGVKHVPDIRLPTDQWYSGGLKLEVLTSSCGANQAQQFFQVTNMGANAVALSDITIRFWFNDTSGSAIVSQVNSGWRLHTASTYPSCYHQVQGTTASVVQVTPARVVRP